MAEISVVPVVPVVPNFKNLVLKKLLVTDDYVRCRIKNTSTGEIIHYYFNGETTIEYYISTPAMEFQPINYFKVPENHVVTFHEYECEKLKDGIKHSFSIQFHEYSVIVDCIEN